MVEARPHVLPEEPDGDRDEGKMGFLEHLENHLVGPLEKLTPPQADPKKVSVCQDC